MPESIVSHRLSTEVVTISCKLCGKPFTLCAATFRARKVVQFCSRECADKAKRKPGRYTEVSCRVCGKVFRRRTDKLGDSAYCSKACFGLSCRRDGAKWRDPEQIREYMGEYHRRNRDRHNELSREWIHRNPEAKRGIERRYRANRAGNGPVFTESEWAGLKAQYGHTCLRCGLVEPWVRLESDHVVPVSRQGSNLIGNIQPLCRSCNAWKGDRTIDFRPSTIVDAERAEAS